jgi:hypothetical protein
MLGYDPDQSVGQVPFDFIFDDDAQSRSIVALMEDLPQKVFSAHKAGTAPPTLLNLFDGVCNETPATKRLISDTIVKLREMKEFEILTSDGRSRPRAQTIDDTDVVVPAKMRDLFSLFSSGS